MNTDVDALKRLQLRFRLENPLNWKSAETAYSDLVWRVSQDEEFALDVVDYSLRYVSELEDFKGTGAAVAEMSRILTDGGSAWEVGKATDGGPLAFQLVRRAIGPVRDAIAAVSPESRADSHLRLAWSKLNGRNPDPSGAYRESIRAIESVGKPVFLPRDSNATLGKMIAHVRDTKPEWRVALGDVDDFLVLANVVWGSQTDRHGTDDTEVPMSVSQPQADVAFYFALALVRMIAGGEIERKA